MTRNPYAPPKAEVSDRVNDPAAPALWNPGAAANWSLLFSPAFGAFLHMKNWQALGVPGKATTAKIWIGLTLCVLALSPLASALMPANNSINGVSRLVGIILLFGWYLSSGHSQMGYVKSRFGKDYPRRGWGKPVLFGVFGLAGYFVYAYIVAVTIMGSTVNHGT
jgi:hypothetical protein